MHILKRKLKTNKKEMRRRRRKEIEGDGELVEREGYRSVESLMDPLR